MRKWPAATFFPSVWLCVFVVVILLAAPSGATGFPLVQIRDSLKKRLSRPPLAIKGSPLGGTEMMPLAYRSRAYAPFWIDADLDLKAAKALIEAIGRAGQDGLRPSDYHLTAIYRLLSEMAEERSTTRAISPQRWADLDLVLTDAFLLLGSHLLVGRMNPETLSGRWKIDPGRAPLLPSLIQAAATGNVDQVLNTLRPSHRGYTALRNALRDLKKIDAAGGWPKMHARQTLRLGDHGDGVAVLRRRLIDGGDLAPPTHHKEPERFDAVLEAAVKRFQRRHGIADDGVVGRETVDMLNVPVGERIQQVKINLERWRWLPHHLGHRYIVVNTAAFSLHAMENQQTLLRMRVIVGRPARRSPVLSSKVSYLVINPFWTVPTTIAVEDMLPVIQKDVAYLTKRGIRVYADWRTNAVEIDPASVDWRAYHAGRFPFTFRQDPGPRNALGRIKFVLPNTLDVYLHDTPDHTIFRRVQRDLSSGCIRVEDPLALARFVMNDNEHWTSEALAALVENGETSTLRPEQPVPVHLLYMTAWVDEKTVLQFRRDIYHWDGALAGALYPPRPGALYPGRSPTEH